MEIRKKSGSNNRPDEWMIEQGMAGHKLPILDQAAGKKTVKVFPPGPYKISRIKRRFERLAIATNSLSVNEKAG